MKIVSKKNKPIASFKFTKYNIIIIPLFLFITFCVFIFNDNKTPYNNQMLYAGITLLFFIILFICIVFKFEMYNGYFTASFSLVFLPFKITFNKILFENIDWVDCYEVTVKGRITTFFYQMSINMKTPKLKAYVFDGKKEELEYIAYNWKTLAKNSGDR